MTPLPTIPACTRKLFRLVVLLLLLCIGNATAQPRLKDDKAKAFAIFATEYLPGNYFGMQVKMGTEKSSYRPDLQYLISWIDNATDKPLTVGRDWRIQFWNGEKWIYPPLRKELYWTDDALEINQIFTRYYFKYPIGEYYTLKKGKYRLTKIVIQEKKPIELKALFEVR